MAEKKMHEIKIDTIGELIGATEERLKQAKYIADVRARNIKIGITNIELFMRILMRNYDDKTTT